MDQRSKCTAAPSACPERTFTAHQPWLMLPVCRGDQQHRLEFFAQGRKFLELMLPCGSELRYEAAIPVPQGIDLVLRGQFDSSFFERIHTSEQLPSADPLRPLIHYAPDLGWANDPNGLVLHDGIFELYYQYNPCDTVWNNMSWAHTRSTDLLHWSRAETVLLPTAHGTVFSGCALRNERGMLGLPREALLYFYTVAGGSAKTDESVPVWSAGQPFTQNYAYSLDGGKSIVRPENSVILGDLGCDARDPKIFWYEPRQSYCMILYLRDNLFAVLHSFDLLHWKMTQKFSLPNSWECPNLFPLRAPDGREIWVFWSADGYYYLGSFDGLCFQTDCMRHLGARTALPYAAQIYDSTPERVVMLSWLRTKNTGRNFCGMYGIPRELSLANVPDGIGGTNLEIRQRPVQEWFSAREHLVHLTPGETFCRESESALELELSCRTGELVHCTAFGLAVAYDPASGVLRADGQEAYLAPALTALDLILDRGILEVSARDHTIYAAFETKTLCLRGKISLRGAFADVYTIC